MDIPHPGQLFLQLAKGKITLKLNESQIERSICDFLTYKGFDVIKVPSAGYYDSLRKRFRKHASPYVRNGIPDLLVMKPGVILFLEVKSEKGIQSDAQKDFQGLLEKNGQKYYIVRSIEDVETIIKGR